MKSDSSDIKGEKQNPELNKKIVNDLKHSGFPLEIECTSILRKEDWDVTNQVCYIDLETKELRTVDIKARLSRWGEKSRARMEVNLMIECKRSKNPWIFYSRRLNFFDLSLESAEPPKSLSSSYNYTKEKKAGFHFGNHRIHNEQRGLIPVEAFSKGTSKRIFQATNQVTKATFDLFGKRHAFLGKMFKRAQKDGSLIFIPVVVLGGKLFSAKPSKSEELQINEEGWIVYDCPISFDSKGITRDKLLVDAVTLNFFKRYIHFVKDELEQTHLIYK